jgi:hypothetical protein
METFKMAIAKKEKAGRPLKLDLRLVMNAIFCIVA